MADLTAEQAIARAKTAAGSDDFGPDGWQEGLNRTLDAFARLPLTATARAAAEEKVVADLATRCRIEAWYSAHPEIEGEEIDGPVIVCGMPRTGTTATVGMMALDPRFRVLRAWEAKAPVPPPVAGQEDSDPRVIAAREAAQHYDKPGMHIHDPDGPEEDVAMLSPLDMRAYHGPFPMPDEYIAWWSGQDFIGTYAWHRRVMKLLQSRRGPSLWLLKGPLHTLRLESLLSVFPDARFVMTHRDPAKVIPSVASLQSSMQASRCEPGAIDRVERGRHYLDFWSAGMARGLAARARIGEERFVDVRNDDVVRDPMAVFARVYDHLGMAMPAGFADKVAQYRTRNARSAGDGHHYTAEAFGLSREAIRARFAAYVDRFGV